MVEPESEELELLVADEPQMRLTQFAAFGMSCRPHIPGEDGSNGA